MHLPRSTDPSLFKKKITISLKISYIVVENKNMYG